MAEELTMRRYRVRKCRCRDDCPVWKVLVVTHHRHLPASQKLLDSTWLGFDSALRIVAHDLERTPHGRE